jgi:hypothetical protein
MIDGRYDMNGDYFLAERPVSPSVLAGLKFQSVCLCAVQQTLGIVGLVGPQYPSRLPPKSIRTR